MRVAIEQVIEATRVRLELGPAGHLNAVLVRLSVASAPDGDWLRLYDHASQHVGKLEYSSAGEHPRFAGDTVHFRCSEKELEKFVRWLCDALEDTNSRTDKTAVPGTQVGQVGTLLQQIQARLDQ